MAYCFCPWPWSVSVPSSAFPVPCQKPRHARDRVVIPVCPSFPLFSYRATSDHLLPHPVPLRPFPSRCHRSIPSWTRLTATPASPATNAVSFPLTASSCRRPKVRAVRFPFCYLDARLISSRTRSFISLWPTLVPRSTHTRPNASYFQL